MSLFVRRNYHEETHIFFLLLPMIIILGVNIVSFWSYRNTSRCLTSTLLHFHKIMPKMKMLLRTCGTQWNQSRMDDKSSPILNFVFDRFFSYFGIGVEFKQNVKWVVAKRHLTWASVSQKIVFLLEGIYEGVFLIIGTIP